MKILFVTQESNTRPSGVKTVINNLFREWNDDELIILMNQKYCDTELLLTEVQNKVQIKRIPFMLPSEILSHINISEFSTILNIVIKITMKILFLVYSFICIIWLSFWLKQHSVDAIINHNGGWPGGELNRWLAISGKLAGVKTNILVLHSMPAKYKLFIKYFLFLRDRFVELCCHKIITVSNSCRDAIHRETGFKELAFVIHNGIPTKKPQVQNTLPPWDKKQLSIGFFGGLNHLKGVHILIESLQYIKTPCELILIGNGDEKYMDYLKSLSEKSKWKVHFLGFRDDALSLYQWVDIVALVSIRFESFGITLLEGMLWSKPVVCSDFGGMKEIVIEKENGLISQANNVKDLAVSLDKILSNDTLRNDMGRRGRKRLEDFFSAKLMYSNYKSLIH